MLVQGHNSEGYIRDFIIFDEYEDAPEYVDDYGYGYGYGGDGGGNVEIHSDTFLGAVGPQIPKHAKTIFPGNLYGIRDNINNKPPYGNTNADKMRNDDGGKKPALIVQPGYEDAEVGAAPAAMRYAGEVYVYPLVGAGNMFAPNLPSPLPAYNLMPNPSLRTYQPAPYVAPGFGASNFLVDAGNTKYGSGLLYNNNPLRPASPNILFNNYYEQKPHHKHRPALPPKRFYRHIDALPISFSEEEDSEDSQYPSEDESVNENYADLILPLGEDRYNIDNWTWIK